MDKILGTFKYPKSQKIANQFGVPESSLRRYIGKQSEGKPIVQPKFGCNNRQLLSDEEKDLLLLWLERAFLRR